MPGDFGRDLVIYCLLMATVALGGAIAYHGGAILADAARETIQLVAEALE